MANLHYIGCLLLMALAAMQCTDAVDYLVTINTTDCDLTRYSDDVGVRLTEKVLVDAKDFVLRILGQNSRADRKHVQKISLFIEHFDGVAYADNNEIHVNCRYLSNYNGDVRREFIGVIYHEMTHIWQWKGKGEAPGGLIEGIADFVRLKAGYAPSHWVQPGQGERWDQGYDVTARFLDYCNSLRGGFVAELNKKMKTGYHNSFFIDLLDKTVQKLWSEYKIKYGS